MRVLSARAQDGQRDATLALDVYTHRLRGAIATMVAALGGLDALVFTGGVGEHSAEVRSRAAAGLAFLGVAIDESANREHDGGDSDVSDPSARVRTLVLRAREDLEVAHQTRAVLADGAP
jgi:acetate kinase